jgi:general secretion pathway protein I
MSRGRADAFTLVEVLVSLAIFAIAAVVLAAAYLNVISGYTSMSQRQQQEEDWKFVREQVLTQPDRATLEQGGRLSLPDGRSLSWAAKLENSDIADVFRVTLRVEAAAGGTARDPWKREQTLLLLRPAWSDPADRDKLRNDLQQQLEKARAP